MEALQLCLERGVDVNGINDRGETAVHAAAGQGSDKIVQLLADKGAKLDVKDKKGRTPVDIALGINADMVGVEVHESTAALIRQLLAATATTAKDAGTQ
jgi:ankyrin repeat protein